jgi:hypothetical protein
MGDSLDEKNILLIKFTFLKGCLMSVLCVLSETIEFLKWATCWTILPGYRVCLVFINSLKKPF